MNALRCGRFRLWSNGARVAAVVATIALIQVTVMASVCAAAQDSKGAARTMPGHLHRVHAMRLHRVSAADGAITAGAPDSSWGIRVVPIGAVTVEIIASPSNQKAPAAITLAMIQVSDILSGYYAGLQRCTQVAATLFGDARTCEFNNIQHHAAVAQRRWSAADGMRALASVMPSYGDYPSNLSIRARSPTLADVTYDDRLGDGSYSESGLMQMVYAPNPYLTQFESGAPEWVSLGFLSVCRAQAGQLGSALRACRAVLGSMQYSQAFKTRLVQRAMNEYASQVQTSVNLIVQAIQNEAEKEAMIAQFSQSMATLQAQREQIIAHTNAVVDRGWWNALGGLTDLRDPKTGEEFNVSDQYRYYCRGPQDKVVGTDDPRDVGSVRCGTKLNRISPGFGEPEQ